MGDAEHNLLLSPGLMLNMIPGMLCAPKARFDAYFIDEEKVKKAKERCELRCGTDTAHGFACSTNDIITSTFANAANAGILLMAINLRNRLQDANDNDAGNYGM